MAVMASSLPPLAATPATAAKPPLQLASSAFRCSSALHRGVLIPSRRQAASLALAASLAAVAQAARRGRRAARASSVQDPESLRWALELAVRAEDYEEAAELQRAIVSADIARPAASLKGLARERVRRAVDAALDSCREAKERHEAVQLLQGLAMPPAAFEEAEDALHRVLSESQDEQVAAQAEAALWSAWLPSGDDAVDQTMRQGLKLLGAGEVDKAAQAFTEVVELAPGFAEGWNKRATALFLAQRFSESIEDCQRVLALKPRHFGCLSGLGICHLRQGDEQSAVTWLRKALEVNPRSGDMQRIVADLEGRHILAKLRPRLDQVLSELRDGREASLPPAELQIARKPARCAWDVFRIKDHDQYTYYFRISVECLRGHGVAGTARYYALKQADGSVFPLSKVTQVDASFALKPGQSYGYSFMLSMQHELSEAQGGLLLREQEDVFEVQLDRLSLAHVPELRETELNAINDGYQFMGRLEIHLGD